MRMSVLARVGICAGVILLAMAGVVGGSGSPARAAAPIAVAAPTSYVTNGYLAGVAAISPSDAWAVGAKAVEGKGTNLLILHWNGRKWSPVQNIQPVWGWLDAVTAVSASDVWAVGEYTPSSNDHRVLVMHWDGKSWRQEPGVPQVIGTLYGVAADASTVWAVGTIQTNAGHQPSLVMHLAGGHWYVVPAPVPTPANGEAALDDVILGRHGTAWAVGSNEIGGVVLRWNGTTWKSVASPLSGSGGGQAFGLAAVPSGAGAVWAVGWDVATDGAGSMVWNGSTWRKVSVPTWASCSFDAVAYVPGGGLWAVGWGGASIGRDSLLYHWNGKSWVRFLGQNLGNNGFLDGAAGTSATNVWAVGSYWSPPKAEQTLILHWNGKAWS
jgi:hypothetical protein